MAIAVQAIFDRLSDLLSDEDMIRWPAEERIRWINDAPGAILARRPAALSRRTVHALAAGTYQEVPDGSTMLLDVVRNMGADGATPGLAIRRTDRQQLDDAKPDWHTQAKKAVIKHFMFDDRTPKVFFVYPPALAGTQVEIIDAALPAPVASEADSLDMGAEYIEAVVNYAAYRANQKDGEYANGAMAAMYFQAFEGALGVKTMAEGAASPNQPGNSV